MHPRSRLRCPLGGDPPCPSRYPLEPFHFTRRQHPSPVALPLCANPSLKAAIVGVALQASAAAVSLRPSLKLFYRQHPARGTRPSVLPRPPRQPPETIRSITTKPTRPISNPLGRCKPSPPTQPHTINNLARRDRRRPMLSSPTGQHGEHLIEVQIPAFRAPPSCRRRRHGHHLPTPSPSAPVATCLPPPGQSSRLAPVALPRFSRPASMSPSHRGVGAPGTSGAVTASN